MRHNTKEIVKTSFSIEIRRINNYVGTQQP